MKASTWREPGSLEPRIGPSDDTSSIDVHHAVAGCGRTPQTVRPQAYGLSNAAPVVSYRKLQPSQRTANTPVVGLVEGTHGGLDLAIPRRDEASAPVRGATT